MEGYYILYFLNDGVPQFYGLGDLPYMIELLDDYINTCKIYGKDSLDFRIEKVTEDFIKETLGGKKDGR